MLVEWLRDREDHPIFGQLEPGRVFEAPADLADAWIAQGAARAAAAAAVPGRAPRRRDGKAAKEE